jgi:anti-sigma B factor antagonist
MSRYDVGRRTVLSVDGEVDIATAPELATAIDEAFSMGASELWVDLSATEFMDSAGIHTLLNGEQHALELNRTLIIICPSGPVRRVLEISGMLAHFTVYENREAANRAA